MPMDMLEHENFGAESSIAARGSSTILSLGDDGTNSELTKSFLIKRMEINFLASANYLTDDNLGPSHGFYALVFTKTSVDNTIDTIGEQLDTRLEDIRAHQNIIWFRYFYVREGMRDDTDNVTTAPLAATFNTSKSFSKGFRLDKDETYIWAIFNPDGGAAQDTLALSALRVRYWGVHIE